MPAHRWELQPAALAGNYAGADCNTPVFWHGDTVFVFNSIGRPQRASGPSLEALGRHVDCTWDGPEGMTWWIEAVWYDEEQGRLYGWYHHEPHLPEKPGLTAPKIGAIVSDDLGLTWRNCGFVITNAYPNDLSHDNGYFVGGTGDFHVILDAAQQHFWFFISTYAGPASEQGIAVARSRFADRGQPGTVWKYRQGQWDEPGLGGEATPLFGTALGWVGPTEFDCPWGPSVHWNSYLDCYVMVLNRALRHGWMGDAIEISFSDDLLQWSEPQPFYRPGGDVMWYPCISGVERGGTDTRAGRVGRFFLHGGSEWVVTFGRGEGR